MKIHPEIQKLDKWVSLISDDDSMHQAASYSLRDRLASVRRYFPGAALSKNESSDDVHQLRVATRRTLAVLDLYGELLPTKPAKRFRRTLEKIQRKAGALRDLDVVTKRYRKVELKHAKKLVKALVHMRYKVQLNLAKLYLRLWRSDRFLRQSDRLLSAIETSDTCNALARTWMKTRWSQLLEQFYQSADVDTQDLDALHRFRISGKQLRYGFELLAPAFAPQQREGAYELLEQLQDRLGRLHDHVFAHQQFCKWDSKRNRVSRACHLDRLIDYESELLQKERVDFIAWWTPSRRAEMQNAFDQLTT